MTRYDKYSRLCHMLRARYSDKKKPSDVVTHVGGKATRYRILTECAAVAYLEADRDKLPDIPKGLAIRKRQPT